MNKERIVSVLIAAALVLVPVGFLTFAIYFGVTMAHEEVVNKREDKIPAEWHAVEPPEDAPSNTKCWGTGQFGGAIYCTEVEN